MKGIRAIRSLAVVAGIAIVAVGCSSGSTATTAPSSEPTAEPTTAAASAEAPSQAAAACGDVALIVGVTNNPFYTSMIAGAQAKADELGVNLTIDGGTEWDASKQVPILNAVIARAPDGIVYVPNDPTAANSALKDAAAAGIVVATADTDVNDPSLRIINYASDNVAGGVVAGEALLEQIGGKGKVFMLNAIPGTTTSVDRQKGFEQAIDAAVKSGDVTYLPVQFSQSDQTKGTAIVSAVLQAHPDLAGIFAEDTLNGQATGVAVENAGLAGKVKVVAYDASPIEVDLLKKGTLTALIGQKPYDMGGNAVAAVCDYISGNTTEYTGQSERTDFVVMTKENIDDPDVAKFIYPAN